MHPIKEFVRITGVMIHELGSTIVCSAARLSGVENGCLMLIAVSTVNVGLGAEGFPGILADVSLLGTSHINNITCVTTLYNPTEYYRC